MTTGRNPIDKEFHSLAVSRDPDIIGVHGLLPVAGNENHGTVSGRIGLGPIEPGRRLGEAEQVADAVVVHPLLGGMIGRVVVEGAPSQQSGDLRVGRCRIERRGMHEELPEEPVVTIP